MTHIQYSTGHLLTVDSDEGEEEDDSEAEGREEVTGASEGAFAGGDGKFTYIGALKGSHLGKGKGKGKGEKKAEESGSVIGGDKGSAALSEFPPLSPSPSAHHHDASVAIMATHSNVKESENDADSGDIADLISAMNVEDGEECSHDEDVEDDNNCDNDSEEERVDAEGGEEGGGDDDEEDSDVEDDISRYQREIEEKHNEKEAQALKDVSLASNCGGLTVQAVDSAIECALLKVSHLRMGHVLFCVGMAFVGRQSYVVIMLSE